MTGIKAIETIYRGYRMRSRLEARWAVYFDAIGVEWEYEIEGFETEGGKYLPDFWLKTVDMWAEVKAKPFNPAEIEKANSLVAGSKRPLLMLVGTPAFKKYQISYMCSEEHQLGGDIVIPAQDHVEYRSCLLSSRLLSSERRFVWNASDSELPDPVALRAVEAARSARFEFGEHGPLPTTSTHLTMPAPSPTFAPAKAARMDHPKLVSDLQQLQERWPELRNEIWSNPIDRATFRSCELVGLEGKCLVLRLSSGNLMLLKDEKKRTIRGNLVRLLGPGADVRFIDDRTEWPPHSKWDGLGVGGKTVRAHWEDE
jgi:hypothetical protein